MKIAIIGGNRLIATTLLEKLREDGHEAAVASPDSGVSTLTGEGLAETLRGAAVVVDLSTSLSFQDAEAETFFETFRTRNLLVAEAAAGVRHHVALSVVGNGRLSEGAYFRAKFAQEGLIKGFTIPFSIVHATQCFELLESVADAATDGTTVRLPPVFIQPMAADDVASAVGRTAVGTPLNGIVELAGPERFRLDELVRRILAARHDPREVVADPHARYLGAALGERALVPGDDVRLGKTRFEDWLATRPRHTKTWCPVSVSTTGV